MEPTNSEGPPPILQPVKTLYATFIDSIEAAAGDWIETPLDSAAGNTHTGLLTEAGRRYAEITIRDGVVYGRLRTDTP